MRTARQVAQAIAELTPHERKKVIELVPDLLRREEAFVLRRRRQGRRDLLAGRTVSAQQALIRVLAKRRSQ
jgi:gamma-glutamyl phosphate reductase